MHYVHAHTYTHYAAYQMYNTIYYAGLIEESIVKKKVKVLPVM